MDKWEQLARLVIAQAQLKDPEDAIIAAFRQCEADTIRRCADEVARWADDATAEDQHGDAFILRQARKGILSLLPKEPGQ